MIRAAIVEDEKKSADLLKSYLDRFGKKNNEEFNITTYKDAVGFLTDYKPVFDIVFMDIKMPYMDGMSAAGKLREIDSTVSLIFVTNMGDYAVKGYDVGAIAFIKKPLLYYDFEMKMNRAVFAVRSRDNRVITVSSGNSKIRLMVRDLAYIQVSGHRCTYHMNNGEIVGRNSLSELYKELAPYDFMMCNSCYLINPNYIRSIDGNTVKVGEDSL